MREDGLNSGGRGFGRLCLALIPWALGIGLSVWLGVWIGLHNFRHQLSQEERAAIYTGAGERPKSRIIVEPIVRDCSKIIRADQDGAVLLLYARNDCHERLNYLAWYWQALSSNGTVLKEGYTNWRCPTPNPGDVAECRMEVTTDDRVAKMRVWTQISP